MPSLRSLTVVLVAATATGLQSCRSKAPSRPSTQPPTVAATPKTTPSPAVTPIEVAPWQPATTAPTPGGTAPAEPALKPTESPPESTELRPCVPAPALPGSPYYWLPATPAEPVSPATAPAVPAAPLTPASQAAPAPAVQPTPIEVAPSATPAASTAPAPAVSAPVPTTADTWPVTAPEFFAELRRRTLAGQEPDLAPLVDLLDAAIAALPAATQEIANARLRDVEATEAARALPGLAWASLSTYVEPGADATAMRAAYLDFDRVEEYTGKPGTRTIRREGNLTLGRTDAMRKVLSMEFGARWTFRAKSLDRGVARIIVTTLVKTPDMAHMVATRGMMIAFPMLRGLLVVEANASFVDFEIPGIIKGPAEMIARKELLARINGARAHWREYLK